MRPSCASLTANYSPSAPMPCFSHNTSKNAVELELIQTQVTQIKKRGAHLVTALTRLHVHNLERRSNLEALSTREEKGGEERSILKNSVC